MKTARFAAVIEQAGAPMPHPLWVAPEKDPTLQRALKENRVLTVHQDVRGTRKDYGLVGFDHQPEAQFLIFPKSLHRFRDRRIVGIDYELLAEAARAQGPGQTAEPATDSRPSRRRRAPEPVPPEPKEKPARPGKSDKGGKKTKPPVVVAFAPAEETEAETEEEAVESGSSSQRRLRSEVQTAVDELKAGKVVAAHERLVRLLERL